MGLPTSYNMAFTAPLSFRPNSFGKGSCPKPHELRKCLVRYLKYHKVGEDLKMIKTIGASAVIKYNNKYIFEIQKSHKWYHNSKSDLIIGIGCIGGSIEDGESPIEALRREVKEEIKTEVNIMKWTQPFTVNSNLEVTNESKLEENLFYDWYGTKEPYNENRICVFLGEVVSDPFPGDLPGLLVTDIQLLIECVKNQSTIKHCIDKGMEIISKEKIPLEAKIKGVGTVKTLEKLYENHKLRLKHLL